MRSQNIDHILAAHHHDVLVVVHLGVHGGVEGTSTYYYTCPIEFLENSWDKYIYQMCFQNIEHILVVFHYDVLLGIHLGVQGMVGAD